MRTMCSFDGCDRPSSSLGLCSGHYNQKRKGRELTVLRTAEGQSEVRFWAKVDQSGDCWLWTGNVINSGYGSASVNGKKWLAHRYVYAIRVGDISEGGEVDHLCRNKLCVRPDHLRAVTHIDNVRAQGLRTNNTSGVRGVNWDKARGKWAARVNVGGKKRHVGRFDTLEEAAQAVAAARTSFYADHG